MHLLSGEAVETVLKLSVDQKTADNITVVIICFKNLKKVLKRELNFVDHVQDTEDDAISNSNNDDSGI